MVPYLLIYIYVILSLCFTYQNELINKKPRGKLTFFSSQFVFFIVFLFAAFRGNGDGDYFNYLNGVKQITTLEKVITPPRNFSFEFSFRILSYLSNLLNFHPQFVLVSMNLISFLSIYYVLKRTNIPLSLGIFIFFPIMLLYDMHHSRSAVAMSLGLVFFVKLWEYDLIDWWKTFFYFFAAYSFHKSSVVLLILPFIVYFYRYTYEFNSYMIKYDCLISLAILIVLVLLSSVMSPFNLIIKLLDNPYTQYFHIKIQAYLESSQWGYSFRLYDPRLLMTIVAYFSFYILENEEDLKASNDKFYMSVHKVYFVSLLSLIILSESTIIALRIYFLFNVFSIIYLSRLLFFSKKDTIGQKTLKLFIIFSYFLYTIALIREQIPYFTVFQR